MNIIRKIKEHKFSFFFLSLALGIIVGLLIATRLDLSPLLNADSKTGLKQSDSPDVEQATMTVASEVGKAVVSISTVHTEKVGGRQFYYRGGPSDESPFGSDELFRRFFDDFLGEMPEREYKRMGLGSGVIINPAGYILTNEHVIQDADKITVTLSDGRELKGEVKGRDRRSDLAVIKIDANNLPVAVLGDSAKVKIGQWVVAIGNPFGFALENPEPTVTVGVVSALHRSLGRVLSRDKDYTDLIQTDAAINPGNSGGPLVNLNGEVIAINVAIFSTTGGYQGVGFAIPINQAKRILGKLIEGKKILYGWLGINVQDMDEKLADYFGVPDKKGVLIVKVFKDSPADNAGIKDKDIILSFDGERVSSVNDLLKVVGKAEVGRKVQLEVLRDKNKITVSAEVGERPEDVTKYAEKGSPAGKSWRGLVVGDITDQIARKFGLENEEGVVVIDVDSGSAADEAGIVVGDVIIEINKEAIKNTADFNKVAKDIQGDALVQTNRGFLIVKGK
ncbi:MAG: Do family serine endopeptidase [Candidatus Omnitrophota bacterium]